MTNRVLQRPARVLTPEVPTAPRALLPVPQLTPNQGGAAAWLPYLLPMICSLGGLLFVLANPTPLSITAGVLFAVSSLGVGVGMGYAQRSAQRSRSAGARGRYLDYLRALRAELRDVATRQRKAGFWRHPDPHQLWSLVDSRLRLWERRRADSDALVVRVGVGRTQLVSGIQPAEPDPLARLDAVAATELRRLLADYRETDGVPLTVPLRSVGVLSLVGERRRTRDLARAMIASLVALHPPEDLRVVVCADPLVDWEWLKWLPHLTDPDRAGAHLTQGMSTDAAGLSMLIGAEVARRRALGAPTANLPHRLVVVDAPGVILERALDPASGLAGLGGLGVTVLNLAATRPAEPPHVDIRIELQPSDQGSVLRLCDPEGRVLGTGAADRLGPNAAGVLARRLAPWRLGLDDGDRAMAATVGLTDLLGVADVGALRSEQLWTGLSVADRLRVPVGVCADGSPLRLDLKEAALGGMGPHGLVVGATGSGKSELLRTLVLALGTRHSPAELALVLVDFKGGAAFAGLQALPHVAGMITNLADDLAMVDRMREALHGELRRRQELLRAAGDLTSVWDYQRARADRPDLAPMPSLVVVVDEFGELLSGRPDFAELFVAIGRLGRSLGVHLLLASQRLEEGKLRGLDSHLSYRIGLRTFSAEDSRAVLGVPDAYRLPPVPGSAYLKVDTTVFTRFKVALASAAYRAPDPAERGRAPAARFQAKPAEPVPAALDADPSSPALGADLRTVLDVAVARLAVGTAPVHQVWLPPLPSSLLLPGALAAATPAPGSLRIPVGLVDRPLAQARDVLAVDLLAAHLIVVGGPRSGKSTLLRTLISAAALSADPTQLHVLGVDAGGGGLAALGGLPQVAGVATRLDRDRVRRVVATAAGLLDRRERLFRTHRIDGAVAMRAARASGTLPAEDLADVLLVVDGWAAFRNDFEELEPVLVDLATRGLGYGLHLVIAAGRWGDIRAQLRDAVAGRLELRLADPADSDLDRRLAQAVPEGIPGRGLTRDKLYFQTALPDLGAGTAALVADVATGWVGPRAPAVRLLPAVLTLAELRDVPRCDGVPIGIGEIDLGPVLLDLRASDGSLLVLGDSESGKTTLLRTFLHGLQARHSSRAAVAVVVDYRRTLLDAVDADHLLSYAGAAPAAAQTIAELARLMTQRLPPADVDRETLRARGWWSGPEVYVVVDDYDLVATPAAHPLAPLAELLPQAADIGLHVVLARRVAGISRAMYDAFLGRLRELGCAAVLLSGDPAEGPLIGPYRAGDQPPGRGLLLRRRQAPLLIQVAITDLDDGITSHVGP